jgi:hypothetical protein
MYEFNIGALVHFGRVCRVVWFATRNVGRPGCGIDGCVCRVRLKVRMVGLHENVRL